MKFPPLYAALIIIAVALSTRFWLRLARTDKRLLLIYLGATLGALIGSKLGWICAEGWRYAGPRYFWIELPNSRTILGALLGGYFAVEILRRIVRYRVPTGDWFATVVPLAAALGWLGVIFDGRRHGIAWNGFGAIRDASGVLRWPAAEVEFGFNIVMAMVFFIMRRRRLLPGQHFHLYLIAYGTFRFFHEIVGNTPREFGPFSGYQALAIACVVVGIVGFITLARAQRGGMQQSASLQPSSG